MQRLAKDTEVIKKDVIIQSLKKRLRKEERHNRNLSKRLARIKQFAELSMDGEVLPVKGDGGSDKRRASPAH
ncbi:MAG: hypothetical protein MZV49_19820 [Rhodopseudomonas palustris]|nr:hypothetical protein [Rhodopseudomonas palustris]